MLDDLLSIFYPRLCLLCDAQVHEGDPVCPSCNGRLPRLDYHTWRGNPVEQLFYGRFPIVFGAAYLLFNTGNETQQLIHNLKYKNRPELGYIYGREFGDRIREGGLCSDADTVIPVPLHPMKKHKRGYNQSEWIARGVAEGLGVNTDLETLFRAKYTETQTRKTRFSRMKNMESAFGVAKKAEFSGKHAIIVDDVLTTGATLESCALTLQAAYPELKVSIISLAIGEL